MKIFSITATLNYPKEEFKMDRKQILENTREELVKNLQEIEETLEQVDFNLAEIEKEEDAA